MAAGVERRVHVLLVAMAPGLAMACGGSAVQHDVATDPFTVIREADRLAAGDLWPNFDFQEIPVAIYDGLFTVLFRHPAPPDGFEPVPGHEAAWAFTGRHPAVTANSSADLAGVRTATLLPPTAAATLSARAGLLIHEAFHVFQREWHPAWAANEVDLFTYPVDNEDLLALRRLETDALRRALRADEADSVRCWARVALDLRRERFAALPANAAAYERHTELHEGLATYVELRAMDVDDGLILPATDFTADAVRERAYRTGAALARLLDRFDRTWRDRLERADPVALDVLLATALSTHPEDAVSCTPPPAEREQARTAAAADVRALRAARAERRRAFLGQAGWTLEIVAAGAPLFPQGFDPLNVQTVAPGEVLHMRFLRLGNEAGTIEVIGRTTLTEAAGAHPLSNGVRRATLTGLAAEPSITEEGDVVLIAAEGMRVELSGAAIERSAQRVTVRLGSER